MPIKNSMVVGMEWGTNMKIVEIFHDLSLALLNRNELKAEVLRLRAAIRLHRDEKGHDRCWLDDQRLYSVLPEGVKADMILPCREEFLSNCARYWSSRQPPEAS